MVRLFDLSQEIEALLNASVGEGGEINEDALAELEALEETRDAKALSVCKYLLGQEAEADAIDAQAKRLRERAQIHRNHAARLRAYVEANVPAGTKLSDECVSVSWRKSSAVVIDAEADVPEKYWRVKMEMDKRAIGDAIKAGEDVKGAHVEARMSMVVK